MMILLRFSAQAKITEVTVSPPFEGHRLLNISWRWRKQRERMLQLVARGAGQREREGWEDRGGWRCGEGRKRGRVEDLVRAFLFLLFDLTDCHTQSTPSLSLHPSLAESLCFHGNRLPCLPDNAPPPQPPISNAVIITVPQRHGESGQERGRRDVDGRDRKGKEMEDGKERDGGGKGEGMKRGLKAGNR